MKNKEIRKLFFKNAEIRTTEKEGKRIVEGIIPYNSRSVEFPNGMKEIIMSTAFNKTINDKANVFALYNHDDSKILGSTKSGTLILDNTSEGLRTILELGNSTIANDVWDIISRGDCTNLSFGFLPIKQEIRGNERYLKEVNLKEISFCVSSPAYPETDSIAITRGFMKRKIDIESISAILEKEELTEEDVTALQEVIDNLTNIIKENSPEKEDEAARAEPPKEDTPKNDDTSAEPKEDETEKEEIKQEILGLIDTLFEIEKETSNEEEKEETNE
jgi:HK97 family phage prohead protease